MNTVDINRDVETLRTNLTEINKICKDIKIGSIISDEDYKKLISLAPGLKSMFALTAGGYAYTGSEDLNKVAQE
jgi:hypothetical protein